MFKSRSNQISRFTLPVLLAVNVAISACSPIESASAAASENSPVDHAAGLSPNNATLILVDYLSGLLASSVIPDPTTLKNNATALSKMGNIFALPTIVVGDENAQLGTFVQEIVGLHPESPRISRTTPSAFRNAGFVREIEKTGRKKLIIGGISTDMCVALTVLDALRNGYEVYVVVDASGSQTTVAQDAAILRLMQAGAIPVTWVALAAELMGDWNSQYGQPIQQLFRDHLPGS